MHGTKFTAISTALLLAVVLSSSAAYYRHTIIAGNGAPTGPLLYDRWEHFWIVGLIGDKTLDVAQICPSGNATIESFNGRFREECLNVHWFASLEDAQQKIDAFRWDYNENHPHRALKGCSPNEYARRAVTTAADSPSEWS